MISRGLKKDLPASLARLKQRVQEQRQDRRT
jgi:hypothetical protein